MWEVLKWIARDVRYVVKPLDVTILFFFIGIAKQWSGVGCEVARIVLWCPSLGV